MIAAQRFDKSALMATIFASAQEADAARRQALPSALRWWRSAVDPILQILASREAFHSVRLIVKRWIQWKPVRTEQYRPFPRLVENHRFSEEHGLSA